MAVMDLDFIWRFNSKSPKFVLSTEQDNIEDKVIALCRLPLVFVFN